MLVRDLRRGLGGSLLFLGALSLVGCSQSVTSEANQPVVKPGEGRVESANPVSAALVVGGAAELKATVARQKGRVVVIDFWATY